MSRQVQTMNVLGLLGTTTIEGIHRFCTNSCFIIWWNSTQGI